MPAGCGAKYMALCPSPVFKDRQQYADEELLSESRGFSICDSAFQYQPRRSEETVLYSVVAEKLEPFLARQQARGRTVPGFVENDLRDFLDCGILERGFIRVHCDACGMDRVVPFS